MEDAWHKFVARENKKTFGREVLVVISLMDGRCMTHIRCERKQKEALGLLTDHILEKQFHTPEVLVAIFPL